MKPEDQILAIAEACGWRCCKRDIRIAETVHTNPYHSFVGIEPTAKEYDGTKDWQYWVIPNYPYDLNAMHEAEKVLTYEQKYQYAKHFIDYEIVFATAPQRSEAFLRTLNLWKP